MPADQLSFKCFQVNNFWTCVVSNKSFVKREQPQENRIGLSKFDFLLKKRHENSCKVGVAWFDSYKTSFGTNDHRLHISYCPKQIHLAKFQALICSLSKRLSSCMFNIIINLLNCTCKSTIIRFPLFWNHLSVSYKVHK